MFSARVGDDADAVTVTIAGDIDVAAVAELRRRGLQAIADAHGRPVVLDAAEVTFIDSTGLGALVQLNNTAQDAGTSISLRAVPRRMAFLLHTTALDSVFKISDS